MTDNKYDDADDDDDDSRKLNDKDEESETRKTDAEDDRFDDEQPAPAPAPAPGMPPPKRDHKYSTADMKPENPWKRWCMTLLTCLVCIAIMVILSLLMQKWFDPPEDEDWSDDAVNATTDDDLVGTPGELSGTASLLPKSLDYIEDVCSEERLGQDDTKACEDACAPAMDCCNPYKNGNSTCFEAEPSGCFAYAKCHSLDGFLDAAHNDLDRICSKASLEHDPTECLLACSSVKCCFTAEESCVASNFEACLDYAACQNLKANSIDVAPTDLDERCDRQTPTCQRDCREALCCSDPNSACYRENFLACLSYTSCNGNSDTKVTVAPMYSRVDPPNVNIEHECSILGMADAGGPGQCLVACTAAACCWESGAGGCFGDDPLGCMQYQRCTILQTPEYEYLNFGSGTATSGTAGAAAGAAAGGGSGGGGGTGATTAPATTTTNETATPEETTPPDTTTNATTTAPTAPASANTAANV